MYAVKGVEHVRESIFVQGFGTCVCERNAPHGRVEKVAHVNVYRFGEPMAGETAV